MAEVQKMSEMPINSHELKKELSRIKARDKELDFRAGKTDEYLSQISTPEKAEQLHQKIMALEIPRLKDAQVHKIIDVMPTTLRDLKVVLQGYTLTISNDGMKKIIDIINDFGDKK
ncbi:hypothetical protein HYU10_02575 [Candidatus Woesearchaeota archaeon]|nr:hypothetical protein [Candidatus Woesearchaeota archaeon]